jgi:O-antigen ligase
MGNTKLAKNTKHQFNFSKQIVLATSLITLSLTPWFNVDSLVVPKLILLFCLSCYLLPLIFISKNNNIVIRLLYAILFLSLTHMLASIILSNAPLEQQMFGRTGRGLGFLTYLSLAIVIIVCAKMFSNKDLISITNGIVITNLVSSIYSIFQKFGIDLVDWQTRTNGVIGTIGNPNFQAAFSGMALVPTITFAYKHRKKSKNFSFSLVLIVFFALYFAESTQGYITSLIALIAFILNYTWYKRKFAFKFLFPLSSVSVALIIFGIFDKGPLASLLYKVSVQSRMEFWRTSWSAALDNPYFGLGVDSLGDYSRIYRSSKDSLGINENFDNAHNYFLESAATVGFPQLIFNFVFLVFILIIFLKLQKLFGTFDKNLVSVFSIWIAFQAQALISPGSISLMTWNAVICGGVIGVYLDTKASSSVDLGSTFTYNSQKSSFMRPLSYFFLILSILVTYPYFNADRLQFESFKKSDALLAVKASKQFPESSVRYNQIGLQLLQSNLPDQALEVARSAVRFNPNSIAAWALLYSNPKASENERSRAVTQILRLDPNNKQLINMK